MKVLVTGGAGYIGSTICSALAEAGHQPIILDSLYSGARAFVRDFPFYHGDIADEDLLLQIGREQPDIACCIHCAARIVVPESVSNPYEYYMENVAKSAILFHNLPRIGVHRIVFSSSAAVYAASDGGSVTESADLLPGSPYARTKYMMEMVLQDFCEAYGLQAFALRYFNPIGADPMMRTGNQVKNPSHVLGKMIATAMGQEPTFHVTGDTWPTRDGSGLRDYLHVWDLAKAHVLAAEKFATVFADPAAPRYRVLNLGAGNGVTVFELLRAFQDVLGHPINYDVQPPREGDVAGACADPTAAQTLLGWQAKLTMQQGIDDALRWVKVRDSIIG